MYKKLIISILIVISSISFISCNDITKNNSEEHKEIISIEENSNSDDNKRMN